MARMTIDEAQERVLQMQQEYAPPDVVELTDYGEDPEPQGMTGWQAAELRNLLLEWERRRVESLRLYEPLPNQMAFHTSTAPERLLRGSNRAGKTIATSVEIAWLATGSHPYLPFRKKGARIICVGNDERHIGQVMWRKLSRPGAFYIIEDETTGRWRSYRPATDIHRRKDAKHAPPLIPERLINRQKSSFKSVKGDIPSLIVLRNSTEIMWCTGKGDPVKGVDVDAVCFDEEISNETWYPEMAARLLDNATMFEGSGLFFWGATPEAGTDQMWDLHLRCQKQRHDTNPEATEHVILLADNPYIDDIAKKRLAGKLSPEQYRVKILGEFAAPSFRVYPEFSMEIHGVDHFAIPPKWCRYAAIDPGTQVCAVLFLAVPPPGVGDNRVYIYDELYLERCDAVELSLRFAEKTKEQQFEAYIIDHHSGGARQIASGKTTEEQYTEEFVRAKVPPSSASGYGFLWGSDNVKDGILAVKGWLRPREKVGTPRLAILRETCPNLEWEMELYRRKKVNGVVTEDVVKRNDHLCDDVRYLAMHSPQYVKPRPSPAPPDGALAALHKKWERQRMKNYMPGQQAVVVF